VRDVTTVPSILGNRKTVPDTSHPLLEHLPLIERLVASLARRKHLDEEHGEEFAAYVRLQLVKDDSSVLTQFKGGSKWSTYLTTVITRLFVDHQRHEWGRWRPSAAAKRLGATAIRLDELLHRDGIPFEEAAEMLRRNHGVELSVAELAELAGQLTPRPPRRAEGEEALAFVGVEGGVEEAAEESERAAAARRLETALDEVLAELEAEDRLFLQLYFDRGLPISDVSRMLGWEQKPLYRRRDRLFAVLRRGLEERGLNWDDVEPIFESRQVELEIDFREPPPTTAEARS